MVQKVCHQSLAWVFVLNVSTRVGLSGAHPFAVFFSEEVLQHPDAKQVKLPELSDSIYCDYSLLSVHKPTFP